jgi:hypothetical protein
MSSVIAPTTGSIDSDQFEISTVRDSDKTVCANSGCSRAHNLSNPIALEGTAKGMAVPFASVTFCSLTCAKEFAENGPYTDVIPAEESSLDQPRYGHCDIYSVLYVEEIDVDGMFEYALGGTPEDAMRNALEIKTEVIDHESISPDDISSTIKRLPKRD